MLSAADLTARGYVVAAIDYRLAPQYKWPAQIEDVKCAVRYLRTNAATYGIDPSRIGSWGESSGAHLASMLGVTDPSAGFEGKEGKLDQSTTVQVVVDMCGPTDFSSVQPHRWPGVCHRRFSECHWKRQARRWPRQAL